MHRFSSREGGISADLSHSDLMKRMSCGVSQAKFNCSTTTSLEAIDLCISVAGCCNQQQIFLVRF